MNDTNPFLEAKKHFTTSLAKGKFIPLDKIKYTIEEEEDLSIYGPLLKNWFEVINNLSFLPKDFSNIEEVFIHSPTNIIIKTSESEYCLDTDITKEDINTICDIFVQKNNLSLNYKEPFVSFHSRLNNHDVRISIVHYSCGPTKQSKVFIRVLRENIIPIADYKLPVNFFQSLINDKKNVLIAGATGSGKTTFTNSLLGLIPDQEHIVIIEDTKELISPNKYTTRLLTDSKNPNKSMNNFLSYSLRMSPERIILGEIRSKEAESSLLSMNTGHNGFISTIHANSAQEAVHRLSLLFKIYSSKDLSFELVLKLITSNINYVVFLKDKQVTEIIELFGSNEGNIFFEKVELEQA